MSHAHTLIRNAAVTALTGLTTTAARVYGNRIYALADANLPGLRVYLNDERVEGNVALQTRTVQLVVECCTKANSSLDTTCDTMQNEVEKALAPGLTVTGKLIRPILVASRYDAEEGSTPVGIKRVFFEIDFHTMPATPDSLT
jgi:hypothetical protein